jgi:heme-degrading monooxygenase HmoA
MIREIADIRVKPGSEAEFVAAAAEAVQHFAAAKGCKAMWVERVIETPGLFRLHVLWETLEDHTVTFAARRGSRRGVRWSARISPSRRRSITPRRQSPGSARAADWAARPSSMT